MRRGYDLLPAVVEAIPYTGQLRGIVSIEPEHLKRAMHLRVENFPGKGQYRVYGDSRTDPHGENWYDVDLYDPDISPRCHCWDFLDRGDAVGSPCKHLLAAMLAEHDQGTRDALGQIISGVADVCR